MESLQGGRTFKFLVPSEFPLHKGDGFPNGDGVCGYDVPITSTPLTAELHFTHNCNLRCKHCFQSSSPNSSRYKELGVSDWIGIFEQFEDCRMHNVTLTGGEIMFYPHFLRSLIILSIKGLIIEY